MNRKLLCLILALLVLLSVVPMSFASTKSSALLQKNLLVTPTLIGLNRYIPARETFEKLGYSVSWVKESATVSIDSKGKQLLIRMKDHYFLKDGILKKSTQAPIEHKGRLMIPLSTAKMIFQQVTSASGGKLNLTKNLLAEGTRLPKLKSKAEYEKLLSFYPQRLEVLYSMRAEGIATPAVQESAKDSTAGATQEDGDFSQTNNQVVGVDESDTVKNDGKYLYAVKNGEVQIFKLGRQSLALHHTIVDSKLMAQQLFITKDYLVVMGSTIDTNTQMSVEPGRISIMPIYQQGLSGINLYRLSDVHAQKTERIMQYAVPGQTTAARLIGNHVYMVTNQYAYYGPMLEPAFFRGVGGSEMKKVAMAFSDMAYFPGQVVNNAMYTVGLDLADLSPSGIQVQSYLGAGHKVYASQSALYLAGSSYGGMWWRQSDHTTDLYAFDLAGGKISYRAKGSVKGDLLNQFSMDAHEGFFRVATTSWTFSEKEQTNTSTNDLYVFDAMLKPVGSLTGLAPGERIYSTRFMGDKLYMVTYRQVDPFYVIDTSVPTKPVVLGYLKIPGYSSYLHPFDDKTIIGIGMETKDLGDRVVNAGVKISLFDVSDLKDPIEKDQLIIGTGNSNTDVSWDHKAFLFNKAKNIMALPIIAETSSGRYTSKDAYIINFTKEGMLNLRGVVTHVNDAAGKPADGLSYWEEHITRILYVGNDLYTLSEKWLQLNDFNTLEVIKSVKRQ